MGETAGSGKKNSQRTKLIGTPTVYVIIRSASVRTCRDKYSLNQRKLHVFHGEIYSNEIHAPTRSFFLLSLEDGLFLHLFHLTAGPPLLPLLLAALRVPSPPPRKFRPRTRSVLSRGEIRGRRLVVALHNSAIKIPRSRDYHRPRAGGLLGNERAFLGLYSFLFPFPFAVMHHSLPPPSLPPSLPVRLSP